MPVIKKGYTLHSDGFVFVYLGDKVSVRYNNREVAIFSALDGEGLPRIGTAQDLQMECAWFLKDNNAL